MLIDNLFHNGISRLIVFCSISHCLHHFIFSKEKHFLCSTIIRQTHGL